MRIKFAFLGLITSCIAMNSFAVIRQARIFAKNSDGKNKVIVLLSDHHLSQFDSAYWDAREREAQQLPLLIKLFHGKNIPMFIEYPDPNDEIGGWRAIARDRLEKNKSVFMLEVAQQTRQQGIPVIFNDLRGTFIHVATGIIANRIALSLNPLNWNFVEYYYDILGYYTQLFRANIGQEVDSLFTYDSIKRDLDERIGRLSESAKELTFLNAREQAIVAEIINDYIEQIKNRYSALLSNLCQLGMTDTDFNKPLESLYERLGDKIEEVYTKDLAVTGSKEKSSMQLNELYNYLYPSAPLTDAGLVLAMIKQLQTHNGVVALIGSAHADNIVEQLGKLGYRLVADGEFMSDKIIKALAAAT